MCNMKNTKADFQEKYVITKNYLKALEDAHSNIDFQCISALHIKNEDGSIPQKIYEIKNDDDFDKANAMAAKVSAKSGLWEQIIKAKQRMNEAELDLIKYALSIVPDSVRIELEQHVKDNFVQKQKLLNIALRWDDRSVASN